LIEERLAWARHEIEMMHQYDYHIVNDHLETAYIVLKSILIAEEHKVRRL
jgi:guanylate kinase